MFTDQTGQFVKDYERFGKKIQTVFPLLDPTITMMEAKRRNNSLEESDPIFMTEAVSK